MGPQHLTSRIGSKYGENFHVVNKNGSMVCDLPPPSGEYKKTCTDTFTSCSGKTKCDTKKATLSASCKYYYGKYDLSAYNNSSLDLGECQRKYGDNYDIINDKGILKCQ